MTPKSHLLLVAFPAWGHTRPLCVLAARLVTEKDDVVVTILTAPTMLEKCRSEISRQLEDRSHALQRIRLVSAFHSDEPDMMKIIPPFAQAYQGAYETLTQEKPITCATTGTVFESVPAPAAVILDFFALPQLHATRALSGRSVPIISWITGSASAAIRIWGPESMGGFGDIGAKIDTEVARTSESPADVGARIYRHTDGSVVQIPGLPAMYDHEFFPQKLPFDVPIGLILRPGQDFLADCDAVLIASSDAYEKESLDALRSWFDALHKPVYAVGPLLPINYTSTGSDANAGNAHIATFLDGILEKHGQRSVVFMSFGTIVWPAKLDYVEEVVEALLEQGIPFILSHASPFARISPELTSKVKASNLGLLTTWSPQHFILNHQATGWFLTHGGFGSITESLGSGTPLICWPFDADQPATAAHLSINLKAAFELIEVRTGFGLNLVHRSGQVPQGTREAVGLEIRRVLEATRGKEGDLLRTNAERLKGEFTAAWEEGGNAKLALSEFLRKYA